MSAQEIRIVLAVALTSVLYLMVMIVHYLSILASPPR